MRLPREWLGPREELVPIAVDEEPIDGLASPPSTHDFWGEAPSDGWAAPIDQAPSEPRRPAHRQRDSRRHLGFGASHARARFFRRVSGRSRAQTQSGSLPAGAQSTGAGVPRLLRPSPGGAGVPRLLRLSPGMAGVVVLMLVGLAVSAGGQAGHPARSTRASRPAARGTIVTISGIGLAPTATLARLNPKPSALRARRSPRRVARAHRATGHRHRHAAHPASPHTRTNTVEQVRYTAPAAATTSPSSFTPPVTTAAPPPAARPAAPPASAATRTSAGSRQPATGAQGALAPGRSPDG